MCEVYSGQPEKWERPNVQTKKQPSPGSRCSLTSASLLSAFMDLFLCNSAIWFCFVLFGVPCMFGNCQRLIRLESLGKIKIFD